uniref:Uncharacterized protein n=1 Tax=Oryza brachyantha TaxID=4533 RepID=J3LW03_ORYBR
MKFPYSSKEVRTNPHCAATRSRTLPIADSRRPPHAEFCPLPPHATLCLPPSVRRSLMPPSAHGTPPAATSHHPVQAERRTPPGARRQQPAAGWPGAAGVVDGGQTLRHRLVSRCSVSRRRLTQRWNSCCLLYHRSN